MGLRIASADICWMSSNSHCKAWELCWKTQPTILVLHCPFFWICKNHLLTIWQQSNLRGDISKQWISTPLFWLPNWMQDSFLTLPPSGAVGGSPLKRINWSFLSLFGNIWCANSDLVSSLGKSRTPGVQLINCFCCFEEEQIMVQNIFRTDTSVDSYSNWLLQEYP